MTTDTGDSDAGFSSSLGDCRGGMPRVLPRFMTVLHLASMIQFPRPPRRASHCAFGLAVALCALSCTEPEPLPDYPILLRIYADPGRALKGASVTHAGRSFGVSDPEGLVPLTLRGSEGQVLDFQVSCPDGYRSPAAPISVALRRIAETLRRPEYQAYCQPLLRNLVVAVRTERGPNLPVLYLGREVARTDRAGAAHFLVQAPPEDSIELTFDTSQHPELRPQNPSARFQIAQHDELQVLSQGFSVASLPKASRARHVPRIINIRAR